MPVCSACGEPLGPPEESVHDPDSGLDNPDAHMKAVHGEKGTRFQCTRVGQFAKPVNPDEYDNKGQEGGGTPSPKSGQNSQSQDKATPQSDPEEQTEPDPEPSEPSPESSGPSPGRQSSGDVYDVADDKSAVDVLVDTVSNPTYGFNQDQIAELEDWAEIYESHIPPGDFEEIIKNFSGISNQKAKLVRQKYEAKINRWVREQYSDSGGPPIGASGMNAGSTGPNLPRGPQGPQGPPQGPPSPPDDGEDEPPEPPDELREEEKSEKGGMPGAGVADRNASRREHAMERRQRALDTMTETMAQQAAEEMAQRFSRGTGFFEILLKSKAKNDPDWFFEKMEEWDMDILDELMAPSESMQEDLSSDFEGFEADAMVDEALGGVSGQKGGGQQKQEEPEPQQQRTEPDPEPQRVEEKKENEGPHWGTSENEDDKDMEDEIFGDIEDDMELEV